MYKLFCVILFITTTVFNILECDENFTKQQQWDNLAREVDTWTDGLGYPIDQGIKDTVIALNLLGFTTRQSCEGHLDQGDANPWIDFTLNQPEVVTLQNQVSEFVRIELSEQYKALKIKYPRLSIHEILQTEEGENLRPTYEKFLFLLSLYQKEAKKELQQLFELLDKFYQTHDSTEDQKLFVTIEGIVRLESYGSKLQAQRPENERKAKLMLYLDEMKAFTDFLKESIFHQESQP